MCQLLHSSCFTSLPPTGQQRNPTGLVGTHLFLHEALNAFQSSTGERRGWKRKKKLLLSHTFSGGAFSPGITSQAISSQAQTYSQNNPPPTHNPPHSPKIKDAGDKSSLTKSCAGVSILQGPL